MSLKLKLLWLWYLSGAAMLSLVAFLSLMPAPDIGVNDKVSHLLTYAILAGWFSLLIERRGGLLWIMIGLIGYGGSIELLQGMSADRYPEWGDLLANTLGIMLGLISYFTPLPRLLRIVDGRLAGLRR